MKRKVIILLTVAFIAITGIFAISQLQAEDKNMEVLSVEKPLLIVTSTDRYRNVDDTITIINVLKNQSLSTIKSIKVELQQFNDLANVVDRQYYNVELNLLPGESTNISSIFIEKDENKGMLISPIIREIVVEEKQ